VVDRQTHHDHIAETLRMAQNGKRAAITLKAAEKKKIAAAAMQGTVAGPEATSAEGAAMGSRKRRRNEIAIVDGDVMDVDEDLAGADERG